MPSYKAPLDDYRFVLNEVWDARELSAMPGFEDATPDVIASVLEEAAKFCEEVLHPLNQSGDMEGCIFENGTVRTPKGFKEAYDKYVEGGWPSMNASPEHGGQGLPHTVGFAIEEFICSANLAFGPYPGLTAGAYSALAAHASEDLKARYLPKMVSGEWSGTMCLTEPHCGTDLGLMKTRAVPAEDGSYRITGTKIFITSGEHDLTSNIIHLVLAKLPDAPAGSKGVSLFVVPKFLPNEDGEPGARNAVSCGAVEHKMGIKASATCVMNFDGAVGWLVAQPNQGMRAMFTMMNAARLGVGIQGLGIAEIARQNAVIYTKERLQGRSLTGVKAPEKPADPLIVHPDVRKNLLEAKAFTEGARALAVMIGLGIDRAAHHPDADMRQRSNDLVALLTPVIKAYYTDMGVETAIKMQQMFGGHGYIREQGMEQFVRDVRISMLYEGANAIQALDLVGRKLPQNGGAAVRAYFATIQAEIEDTLTDHDLADISAALEEAFAKLQQATAWLAQHAFANPDEAGGAATDYLRIFALVTMGWMWLKTARVAQAKLKDGGECAPEMYDGKLKTARFFAAKVLPEVEGRFRILTGGCKPMMEMAEEQF
ncbi:acyl-CoA dehydrogenase C-terminal domain-containing protein [Rhodomicrobium sp. Az07]|uniref:acyl-CoA dehydrogenase C-terminal domain-containing protein n=1 Tax=Rhodomicrobium sp. Az07 TaxID=2839034 RepID=UPI001BE9DA40|nr:acyl-CoA dehydrogenase C-terminal domain-containing protein [Rhodomicrobium sp. Az07]MBT3069960.1 acyl-CoA dehydrogenase C-terminal domain-containing protein [Rhodomicrobium sp. Az07]